MVWCLLSRHSERSCLHSGLWHLLFWQLWVCQDHAAADLRDQVPDGNISLFLFLHTFTSLHPSVLLLCFFCLHLISVLSIACFFSVLLYIHHVPQTFFSFSSMFDGCCNYTQKARPLCNHGLPAHWVISSSFGSKSTEMPSILLCWLQRACSVIIKSQFKSLKDFLLCIWAGLMMIMPSCDCFGCVLMHIWYLFDIIHWLTWYPYVNTFGKALLEFIVTLLCEQTSFSCSD